MACASVNAYIANITVNQTTMESQIPPVIETIIEDMYSPWILAPIGSMLVGLSGIFPFFITNLGKENAENNSAHMLTLKTLLSFAVGGLLGDVFLHQLPDAWALEAKERPKNTHFFQSRCSIIVLIGMLVFIVVEKIFSGFQDDDNEVEQVANVVDIENINNNLLKDCQAIFGQSSAIKHTKSEKNGVKHGIRYRVNGKVKNGVKQKHAVKLQSTMDNTESDNETYMEYGINHLESDVKLTESGYKFVKATETVYECPYDGHVNGNKNKPGKKAHVKSRLGSSGDETSNTRVIICPANGNRCSLNGFRCSLNNEKVVMKLTNDSTLMDRRPSLIVKKQKISIAGYLNLVANCIDNFTHGLAVGGSFLISVKLGILTTFTILIHEIPHEIGDFAILIKSGFTRWDAARAQIITASSGLLGSLMAVAYGSNTMDGQTSWILPFTAGGFLHIALVTVMPDLLKEDNPRESVKMFFALILGIALMAFMTMFAEE